MKPIDLEPGKTATFDAILEVPAGAKSPTVEIKLDATCGGCGGKMVHVGRGIYKCSRRWMFWRGHCQLSLNLTAERIPNGNQSDNEHRN